MLSKPHATRTAGRDTTHQTGSRAGDAAPHAPGAPVLRIRPVPRSEPLTDDERVSARMASTDLATGVRVRRNVRALGGQPGGRTRGAADAVDRVGTVGAVDGPSGPGGGVLGTGRSPGPVAASMAQGSGAGDEPARTPPSRPAAAVRAAATSAATVTVPTVLLAPDTVAAVVTAPLHVAARGSVSRAGGRTRAARPGTSPKAEAVAQPYGGAEIVSVVAPGLGHAAAVGRATDTAPESAPPAGARELRLVARRLLGTCIEVLGGFRPIAQLRPYCAPERFEAIANRLLRPVGTGHGHGATRGSLIAGRSTASGPGRPGRSAPEDRVTVRRVQICDVMEGVAELAVVMSRRNKVWAMAMRMEQSRGRWQCMHMEVL